MLRGKIFQHEDVVSDLSEFMNNMIENFKSTVNMELLFTLLSFTAVLGVALAVVLLVRVVFNACWNGCVTVSTVRCIEEGHSRQVDEGHSRQVEEAVGGNEPDTNEANLDARDGTMEEEFVGMHAAAVDALGVRYSKDNGEGNEAVELVSF